MTSLNDDSNLVDAHDACPICGERDPDMLVWQDDSTVRCANCNAVYVPGGNDVRH